MDCPQCQSDQIDANGICPACGYRVPASDGAPAPESGGGESQSAPGMIEVDYAGKEPDTADNAEKPRWRQELSERLQAIRQKRATLDSAGPSETAPGPSASDSKTSAAQPAALPAARFVEGPPIRKPVPKPLTPPPRQKILQPLPQASPAEKSESRLPDSRDVKDLIDSAVSRKVAASGEPDEPVEDFDAVEGEIPDYEGKLILLSRTLGGLVDLIIILVCTGTLIFAADFFSGIVALDGLSYAYLAALFLLTYFFYSLFFLAASNQTIGMMITDLRVVGIYHERPSFRQLVQRCCGFLISLLGLGFGLIWGLFDRDNQCFHDRISDTQVIRL